MKHLSVSDQNLNKLLGGARYSIDYYQREYRWQTKHVTELVDDLVAQFRKSYQIEHSRKEVAQYDSYFLGSIIISRQDKEKYIVDGQQRLTTLTLLLIHIYRLLEDEGQKSTIVNLIRSQKYGEDSFNLNIAERTPLMKALLDDQEFNDHASSNSISNMWSRFKDLRDILSNLEDLDETTSNLGSLEVWLPYFADWLIEKVILVEISAISDIDAYTIFETMNDRGLSLTPTEMLKGYLLTNIEDTDQRNRASDRWQNKLSSLSEFGKEEGADAIKAWLRSQFANTIRPGKRGAKPGDFDRIGTEFHRWVREKKQALNLASGTDYFNFIYRDFDFFSDWYRFLREAAQSGSNSLDCVNYVAEYKFTLQYPVLLSPLNTFDDRVHILQKLRVVSAFLDILIARRVWNFRAIDHSTMQYTMFRVMCDIRGKSAIEVASILNERLENDPQTFDTREDFGLHGRNGPIVKRLLARLTDFVETSSDRKSRYREYTQFEIEHIWADDFSRHRLDFEQSVDFSNYRNRIGGLVLLPKKINASFGSLPYQTKRKHYIKHNLLAASLHEEAYHRDPGFRQFREQSGLAFVAYVDFRKRELDARQDLYIQIAKKVWNPQRLFDAAES